MKIVARISKMALKRYICFFSLKQNMELKSLTCKLAGTLSFLLFAIVLFGQAPKVYTSGEIYQSLKKLNFLGTVLYVAAHPDDENTRLISYCVNGLNAETYYLSLTRGDGGQNLIGPEIRELLGVLRTEELLAARRVDGGKQMFTRANDFGFSKNAEEAISIWDSEKVKHDVVWAIRNVRPDVIINRFDHRTSGSTHGHHTASAQLSFDLFDSAAKKNAYPEQLKYVDTWQATRLFFNTNWWFYGTQENFDKADKSKLLDLEVGSYFPLLGLNNGEIAALSRSNHKCQGFGSAGIRGEQTEYLELLRGEMPKDKTNLFEGINTTWSRVKGGVAIQKMVDKVMASYDFTNPALSIPQLVSVRSAIEKLEDPFWKKRKLNEIDQIIIACLGLFIEADANGSFATPGDSVRIDLEIVMQNKGNVALKGYEVKPSMLGRSLDTLLTQNGKVLLSQKIKVDDKMDYTSPYWLRKPGTEGIYHVDDPKLIGLPETPRPFKVAFQFEIEGHKVNIEREIIYKYTDSEKGDVFQPFEILPEFSVYTKDKVLVFAEDRNRKTSVVVKSNTEEEGGVLTLEVPEGWTYSPAAYPLGKIAKGQEVSYEFDINPPSNTSSGDLIPVVSMGGKKYTDQVIAIHYDHIPLQRVMMPASAKLNRIEIKKAGNKIAYVMGTGDEIPSSLEQIGYQVDLLQPSDLSLSKLASYDALIMGIRAYNKHDDLKYKQQVIFDYVKNGGNFIVQYNTTGRDLVMPENEIMPYSFKISRDRVTKEEAPITFLAPNHEIVLSPNKITQDDFKGWVQERGLYMPNSWDEHFVPIFACNDPGENTNSGGLIVAPYGNGHCIYTSFSWFRELPAGVPGAFRIFANMISLGKVNKP